MLCYLMMSFLDERVSLVTIPRYPIFSSTSKTASDNRVSLKPSSFSQLLNYSFRKIIS